jgi:DNA-binding SARP family transcriptional activator/tetratricopeptide (TPR) repeat protein
VRSSRVDTFTLVTLGRLTLLSPSGEESESLAKRRVKLALLAVLATAKRPLSRCTLAEMFWGEQDEARARHSLSDALSHLRRELGRRAIVSHGAEVMLAPDAPLVLDANRFADAVEEKAYTRAAALYAGPFLDGVDIEAGPSFEQWVMRERRRLETAFLQVCAQQCLAHARAREWDECGALAARWLETAPLSADAALYRLNALKAPGTYEAIQRALDEFDHLTARLSREFELPPEKPVVQLAEAMRESLQTVQPAPAPAILPAPAGAARGTGAAVAPAATPNDVAVDASPAAPPAMPAHAVSPALGRWVVRLATAGVAAVALVAALAATTRPPGSATAAARPRVAIAVDVPDADSTTAWLADGLPQMIIAQLSRSPDVEVVPTAQVRALLRRRGMAAGVVESADDLRDLGRRLGATLIVSGTVGRDDHVLVLDLAIRDAATGRVLRSDALSRVDAVALADEAAVRVLAAVNAERPGLRIADLETSSVEAYQHYIRSLQTEQEGRAQESIRELDAAIALDSGFVSAVHTRLDRALSNEEIGVANQLRGVLARYGDRATEIDRLGSEVYDALYNGEFERSEAMGRRFVRRYPHDPRSYHALSSVLAYNGHFEAAESLWKAMVSLDSLTMEAGSGPCGPCGAYGILTRLQWQQGKWGEAERSARRWVDLQPEAASSWGTLGILLGFRQRFAEANDALQRAVSLSGQDPASLDLVARMLVMSRQYDAADSLISSWMAGSSPSLRSAAYDLRVQLLRERGQFRESNAAIDRMGSDLPNGAGSMELVRGNSLGRLGEFAAAASLYERSSHPNSTAGVWPPRDSGVRGFCWHHALLADAIAPSGDTTRLRAIADTLATVCAKSFFGRDRLLHHHVRGLIAMQQGRWRDAEAELQQARYGVAETWTRTNAALATTELALNQPRAAIAALRDAYASPLDGMGRYEPRSEIDFLMAQAFRQAGEPDSAAVYEGYVRRAWRNPDPPFRRLLATLPAPAASPVTAAR